MGMLDVGGDYLLQRFNPLRGLQKSRRDLIFVTKEQNSKKESLRDSMFFNFVTALKMRNHNKAKLFSQRLSCPPDLDRFDKKNNNLTKDTILN